MEFRVCGGLMTASGGAAFDDFGMQDHELYRHILGIEAPWQVESVDLGWRPEAGEVQVRLAHRDRMDWLKRAVRWRLKRRQAEPVTQLGVDEKAFRKGHHDLTLVNDLVRGRVLYLVKGRKQSSLDGFWQTLTRRRKPGPKQSYCEASNSSFRTRTLGHIL